MYCKAWTKQELDYIQELAKTCCSPAELKKEFWKKFGKERTDASLNGIIFGKFKLHLCQTDRYTKEEKDFITKDIYNYRDNGYFNKKRFIKEYNERFEHKINEGKLKHLIEKWGVYFGRQNPKEMWKVRDSSHYKVGDEKERVNYIFVKVRSKLDGYKQEDCWQPKQEYLYEKYHNYKLKEGEFVIFIDKNNRNFSIDNLALANRKIQGKLLATQNITKPELRKSLVQIATIESIIEDMKGK